ncbi:MAG: hypothetical protein GC159_06230 [Phycisphaera sp.]|nr:hypothetical protein [Phycisphaera sp.]
MRTTTTRRFATALIAAAIALGATMDAAEAGTRQREDRIEELVYTVKGIEKKVNEATGVRDEVKQRFNPAKAEYEQAHAAVESLETELVEARKQAAEMTRKRVDVARQLQDQLDDQPGVKEAAEAMRAATEKANAVKTEVLRPLTESARYQAVSKQLDDAAARLRAMQADGADPQDTASMRLRVAEIEQELRELVAKALAASEPYRQAAAALDEAEKRLKAERDAQAAQFANDPERNATTTAVDDLRKKQGELQKKLAEAKRAEAKAKPKYAFYARKLAEAEKEVDHQQTLLKQAEDLLRDARAGG